MYTLLTQPWYFEESLKASNPSSKLGAPSSRTVYTQCLRQLLAAGKQINMNGDPFFSGYPRMRSKTENRQSVLRRRVDIILTLGRDRFNVLWKKGIHYISEEFYSKDNVDRTDNTMFSRFEGLYSCLSSYCVHAKSVGE